MSISRLSAAALALVLAMAVAPIVSAAPAHTTPPRRTAMAAPASGAADAPFWSGRPDAKQFATLQRQRLTRARADIARMLAVRGPRTLANTLQPYDDALIELDALGSQAGLMENVHPDRGLRQAAEKASQQAATFGTELSLNRRVYDALVAVDLSKADDETRYDVTRTLRDFRLSGVDKDSLTRARIRALSDTIVVTGQAFDRNIREGSRSFTVTTADLEGLPADFIASHKPDAKGRVTLTIEYPDLFPVLTYAARESVRKRMYMEGALRGWPANRPVLDSLIAQRDRLAHLVGFPTFAEYFTADKMIGSADSAEAFIQKIVAVSGERARRDYDLVLAARREVVPGADHVDWWDRFYWPEKVRRAHYDFDAQQMRPYLPYVRVKQGVLDIASRMFGVSFRRVTAPVWHPSVEAYEMFEHGKRVGRFYLDMHPRKDKYNHAAQFDIRTGVEGRQIPEAALVCNLPGGTAGDPGLCDFEDVNTFFHEFGHLLHALFAGHHHWVGVGGIRTEQDFVEAPSQMLEEWMLDPKVLATFARHYKTGAVVPADMVKRMKRAQEFGQGLDVRRQMVLADYSLDIYKLPPGSFDQDTLFKDLSNRYTFYPFVEGTHFQSGFEHLNGYAAGYYTYMWSLVIAKDLFAQFNHQDLLDPTIATRYRDTVLAPGGSAPARQLVERFLGRPVSFEAYRAWLNGSRDAEPQP